MPDPPFAAVRDQSPGADPFAAVRDQPRQDLDVLAEGRRSAQLSGLKDDVNPSAVAHWFETQLRPALERIAHPQTVSDIAQLLTAGLGGTGTSVPPLVSAVRTGVGRGVEAAGTGLEAAAGSRALQYASAGGAVHGLYRGDPAQVAGALVAPPVLAATGRGLRALGRVFAGERATMPELALAKAEFEAGRLPRPVYEAILRKSQPATAAAKRVVPATSSEAVAPLRATETLASRSASSPITLQQAAQALPEPLTLTAAEVSQGLQYIRRGVPKEKVLDRILSERGFRQRFAPQSPASAAESVVPTSVAPAGEAPVVIAETMNAGERINAAHWRNQGFSEAEIAARLKANTAMTAEFPVREAALLQKLKGPPSPRALQQAAAALPDKLKLSAAEVSQGLKWLKAGVPQDVVLQRLAESRAFRLRFGLPTPESVRVDLATREATGAWK